MLTHETITAEAIPMPSLRPRKTLKSGIEKSIGDCLTPIPTKISTSVEKKMKSREDQEDERNADRQPAPVFFGGFRDPVVGVLFEQQHRPGGAQIGFPCLRRLPVDPRPAEQRGAQFLFQLLELLVQCALGDKTFFRRFRDALFVGDGDDVFDQVKVHRIILSVS